ncbi:hypothetical protein WV31_02825 [Magnetospirillum sp. ME-1]|nr:hypothetical protein WV31_02825 [Magnetospirillum sp. ME-1]
MGSSFSRESGHVIGAPIPPECAMVGEAVVGAASPINSREARFHRHIADEIAEVVAHGGRGTMAALLAHLNVRFGRVTESDLAAALVLAPGHVREAFRDR